MFLTEGLPASLMGVLAYGLLANTPAEGHWLDARRRALIIAELEAEAQAKKEVAHHSFGAALADPRFYALVGMSIGLIAGGAGIFLCLPTILKQSGVQNVWEIGLLSSLPFVVAIGAQQLWARHSDRTAERRWHAAIPALMMAAGWFLVPQISASTALAMLMLTMMAAGDLCHRPLLDHAGHVSVGRRGRGRHRTLHHHRRSRRLLRADRCRLPHHADGLGCRGPISLCRHRGGGRDPDACGHEGLTG